MTRTLLLISCTALLLTGCHDARHARGAGQWPTSPCMRPYEGRQVTVLIAMSSIVPGGIVGHAGIAVDEAYWDYGPKRTDLLQPVKSIRSTAGPWWDDPDQEWAVDRELQEVLDDMPKKMHPIGSLVAVIRVRVTDEQAQAITAFWHDAYERMRTGDDTYRLTARQCASMVGWSLEVGFDESEAGDRLPRDLHMMTPTKLYESLRDTLTHTDGPDKGEPAEITLWQLEPDGLVPWQRPGAYDKLSCNEMPRLRLALERVKHLPKDLVHGKRDD